MNPFPAAASVMGSVGDKQVIQNVGAKRIVGTDLLTLGKVPQFVYYLVDISQICFYANDGTDTWIGGFGYPIAGSIALRDSLQPFQGQRFYDIDNDISYTYQGGAWEGGAIQANVMAPTVLTLTQPTQLTRGREHELLSSGEYFLPKAFTPEEGATLNGHLIVLYVGRGINANLRAPEDESFISGAGEETTSLMLTGGLMYSAVFFAGKWQLYYVDLSTFGVNAGDGILAEGNVVDNTLVLSADFATEEESLDTTNKVKVISPYTLARAVNAAAGASEYNNITGLSPKKDDVKLELSIGSDNTKVAYTAFTAVFNSEPFLRFEELQIVEYEAGELQLPSYSGTATMRIVAKQDGTVYASLTQVPRGTTDEVYLGFVITVDGVILENEGDQGIETTPWLSSSDYTTRHSGLRVTGAKYSPSTIVGKLTRGVVELTKEGANWSNSTVDPHTRTLGATDPTTWTYLDASGAIVGDLATDEVDGQYLADGTLVEDTKYSIQVVYIGSRGDVGVLLGQISYNNNTIALANAENYSPTVPTALNGAVEVSRWIVRGNQYPGSGQLDLTDPVKFSTVEGMGISGSSGATKAADIIAENSSNTLSTTNLQLQLNELSDRTDWKLVTAAESPLLEAGNYLATDTGTYILPELPQANVRIRLAATGKVVPTFKIDSGAGRTEQIVSSNGKFNPDTEFQIEQDDNGIIFELVSDGTNYIL